MLEITEKGNCTGCYACSLACPKKCIEMKSDSEGFWYPEINKADCIECGKCERVCPVLNGKTKHESSLLKCFAAYNKSEKIRKVSSSGGVFTLLAEEILKQKGVVCGAALSRDCKSVNHIIIDDVSSLPRLRTSKYVQSCINNTYEKVKKALESGKKVLFTGTPCQIGGLVSYLGKEYDNLFTQDFICHGVPSPAVWHDYAEWREKIMGTSLKKVSFRNKKTGWRKFSLRLENADNKVYSKRLDDDIYLRAFLKNLTLRPSCYDCQFKHKERQADITLADFWSIHKNHSDIDDDKGISAVIVHSSKGMKLFSDIENQLFTLEVPSEEILDYNKSMTESVGHNPNRRAFFEMRRKSGTIPALEFYTKKTSKEKIRSIISKLKHTLIK